MTHVLVADGFVETYDGVAELKILHIMVEDSDENDFVIFEDNRIRDDHTLLSYLESTGGIYYKSARDYQDRKLSDLSLTVLSYVLNND